MHPYFRICTVPPRIPSMFPPSSKQIPTPLHGMSRYLIQFERTLSVDIFEIDQPRSQFQGTSLEDLRSLTVLRVDFLHRNETFQCNVFKFRAKNALSQLKVFFGCFIAEWRYNNLRPGTELLKCNSSTDFQGYDESKLINMSSSTFQLPTHNHRETVILR